MESNPKLIKYLDILAAQKRLSAANSKIERRHNLAPAEFLDRYYSTSTPVIITGSIDGWSSLNWTLENIKDRLPDRTIEIQCNRNSNSRYEIEAINHKGSIGLHQYIDLVFSGLEGNDRYMVANNRSANIDLLDLVLGECNPLPDWLDPSRSREDAYFWMGGKGTITPYHHDPINLVMAQIIGKKRWTLVSPLQTHLMYNTTGVFSDIDLDYLDIDRFPLYRDADPIQFDVAPSEIVFIPVGWWHHVRSLTPCVSTSFVNFVWPNSCNYF
jgi:ribosomal protein L16 Arg81 hydroxylase